MEQTNGVVIKQTLNGSEYTLPELPHFIVDGYCAETNTIYEFFGCYWNSCACWTFREVITANGDNLAARYEQTMARLEEITRSRNEGKFSSNVNLTMLE